jgi:hypothetical protein
MKYINRLLLLAAGLTVCFSGLALAQKIQPSGIQQIQTLLQAKARWTPAQRKLDSHLLMSAQLARGDRSAATLPGIQNASKHLKFDDLQRVLVDIRGKVNDELLGEIGRLGGKVESSFPKYGAIRAWIPLSNAEALAERADVTFIRPAAIVIHDAQLGGRASMAGERLSLAERRENVRKQLKAILPTFAADRASTQISGLAPLTAPIDISGLVSEGADLVQGAGITGAGVKVGVLSDGVDSLAALQALGDLPADVTVISGQAGSGDEGTAILEIIYDLAPGAQLFYATADGGDAQMATNIQSLATAGCNIIVDDANYLDDGVFQDGVIGQAINTVTASGVLYFASAHNMGNLDSATSGTWEGDFNGTGAAIPAIGPVYFPEVVTVHAFDATHNYDTITANTMGIVTLKWSDPLGASCNDYDLFALDSTRSNILDDSLIWETCAQDPLEYVLPPSDGNVVVVVLYSGAPRALRVDTWGGKLAIGTAGSTCGHNAAASAVTVAATPAQSTIFTAHNQSPEFYSSDGPRKMFYNPNGSAITAGNFLFSTNGGTTLSKVDLTAADCGESDVSGFSPFCGTSAAAPTAAAIAALVMSAKPSLTPSQVITAMKSTALPAHAGFQTRTVGAGIVMANLVVDALNRTAIPSPSPLPAFASQLAGTTSDPQTVTLSNTGTATLTISSITASGDFSASDTCGTSLVAGSNCPISVTFHPTAGGSRTGTLTITDNAFDSPQHVALSGTGQDFAMAAASSSASVAAGATATYTLAVSGLGGFSDSVDFACTGAPSKSNCTVAPDHVTAGSSAQNITVTVTTTAASVGAPRSRPLPPARPPLPGAGSLLMLALALAGVAWAIRSWRQPEVSRRRAAFLTLAAGLLLTLAMAACGGGGGGGGGHTPIPGTPAGTYTLTVTGSASPSSLSHTISLTLHVS